MAKAESSSWEWIKALVIALLLAGLIRYFLFAPIVVDGESMMPTLENSDRLIVNKIGYTFTNPTRFDIIVFHAPGGKDYIKRIIGLPGDHIEYRDDLLYVNGEPVEEPFLEEYREAVSNGTFTNDFTLEQVTAESIIPEGHLFVLGDNRRNSRDSRDIGVVPYEDVIGEANMVFWPLNDIRIAK